jgi:hypothetical protein
MRYLLILVSVILFTGCASVAEGPSFKELMLTNDGKSIVYVYRPKLDATNSLSPPQNIGTLNVILDGKRVSEVSQNGYVPITMSAGDHIISFSIFGDIPLVNLKLKVEPNQRYYVKLTDKVDNGVFTTDFLNTIEIMDSNVGKREISSTRQER